MNAQEIIDLEKQYVVHTYNRPPFVLERGEGVYVYDTEGKAYLDCLGGIAVNALGHLHPVVTAAIQEQATRLLHVSNLYHTAPQALLARDLVESSAADRVYFCNSGTEAVEACIKFARKWGKAHGNKTAFVAFEHSFHGRTMGALALTAKARYQEPFAPLMPGVHFAPFNDLEAARALIAEVQPCGVIVEAVQGEGGIYPASDAFMRGLRAACDAHDALLICDEVQCGMGRTGTLWAYEASGVAPDLIAVAKPLGGGLPIGAALAAQRVADLIEPGDHGSTFAANPLICAVARAVLGTVNQPAFLAGIRDRGGYMGEALSGLVEAHACVTAVRGRGLMWGLETTLSAADVLSAGYAHGILLGSAGEHVVRLLPPYVVDEAEIDQAVAILDHIFASGAKEQ
ncbi:MAG: aspartate aminotransferase family protein [Anaerolineae bacterium]|nr:aspartate aminotransferase family protein [Anaerolineae bacterium]